jgi:ankyrin repeat protein
MDATIANNDGLLSCLIGKGADLNSAANSKDGDTPLIYAAKNNMEKIVTILTENGADLNLKNRHGSTALISAALKG